jgi:hypothetical protein
MLDSKTPTIDQQVKELEAAGWRAVRWDLWQSPWGAYYLGPHGAWKVLGKLMPAAPKMQRFPSRPPSK